MWRYLKKIMPSKKDMANSGVERIEDHRPWGRFIQYAQNQECTVKIIEINPEQQLSKQTHKYRDEYWISLDDGLEIHINGEEIPFPRGSEFYIPRGAIHSVKNTSFIQAGRFLEIAFGIFEETDIVRLEDKYGRA